MSVCDDVTNPGTGWRRILAAVRRWIIGAAARMLVAAVALTVWLVTRSDGSSGYASARAAVGAACGAHAAKPVRSVRDDVWQVGPLMYRAYLRAQQHGGVFPMVWTNEGPGVHYAEVRRTAAGRYHVVTCYIGVGG